MLEGFKKFIVREKLLGKKDKVLLAVSGGIDSVVMCELFHRADYSFGIAHCNFGLRGCESDADEAFVGKLAGRYKVPFHSKRFQTTKIAKEKSISVQMAARELRYTWFEEVLQENKYQCIATAHHLDDQIETFFINLLRSTGIAGFHGILPRQGKIIRPLLFAYRHNIELFALQNHLAFREDSSNQETKYLRNKIRHEVIPVFHELNPAFPQTITENIYRLRKTEMVYRKAIDADRTNLFREDKTGIHIRIDKLKEFSPPELYAFEFLSPYGFNESVISDIIHSLDESGGKTFFSPTHRLVKDRKELIIHPLKTEKAGTLLPLYVSISDSRKEIRKPVHLRFEKIKITASFEIDPSKDKATLDLSKITFPLILKKWKRGDSFYPYGLNKKKKLSDYFIDCKFSIADKENTWLLCTGQHIIWVVGHRIDHRFRVTSRTKEVLQVKLVKGKNR
ncbi:MAG: tRNA lysidine(34) synthetase TilS [Bacteroidetes bacterium]|nr:tRNA lysidine(34) synthetase TilS [Bacteroidota bacterium]